MQVGVDESHYGASGYRHLETESRKGELKVMRGFAYKSGPSYLYRRVRYERGNYAQ